MPSVLTALSGNVVRILSHVSFNSTVPKRVNRSRLEKVRGMWGVTRWRRYFVGPLRQDHRALPLLLPQSVLEGKEPSRGGEEEALRMESALYRFVDDEDEVGGDLG